MSKDLTICQETLDDTRQGFATLQTHHAALKLQLERSELLNRESATQAQDFQARVTDLTADREALAAQLATVAATDKQLRKNFKYVLRCLKASNPVQSTLHYAEELSSEASDVHMGTAGAAGTALQSDLKWVMHRLSELFKEGSAAQAQAAAASADGVKLQEKLSQHLEASKASSAALQSELASAHERAFQAEAEVQLLQQQAAQHAQQLPTMLDSKSAAEQQISELKAAEGELQKEVQKLQGQLGAAQGQLQAAEGQLQAEVGRLQGQVLQARGEEEEAQEERRLLKQQLNKVGHASPACLSPYCMPLPILHATEGSPRLHRCLGALCCTAWSRAAMSDCSLTCRMQKGARHNTKQPLIYAPSLIMKMSATLFWYQIAVCSSM